MHGLGYKKDPKKLNERIAPLASKLTDYIWNNSCLARAFIFFTSKSPDWNSVNIADFGPPDVTDNRSQWLKMSKSELLFGSHYAR